MKSRAHNFLANLMFFIGGLEILQRRFFIAECGAGGSKVVGGTDASIQHEVGLLYLNRDPAFITLHGDLVYKEIVERMGQRLSRSSQS